MKAAQFGIGSLNTVGGLQNTSGVGMFSTALGAAGTVAVVAAKATPGFGQIISAAQIIVDAYKMGSEISRCQ